MTPHTPTSQTPWTGTNLIYRYMLPPTPGTSCPPTTRTGTPTPGRATACGARRGQTTAAFSAARWAAGAQLQQGHCYAMIRAANDPSVLTITEKAPTRASSWLKAASTTFIFKTLLRHYVKQALTPRSLNVKLGLRHNYHKGRAAIRHYANQTARPL